MTMFGIKEAVVAPLVRSIAGEELTTAQIAERFARASWTGIAEPGDRVAGLLVSALGATAALTSVLDRWPTARVVAAVTESGEHAVSAEDVAPAMERWQPRLASASALIALKQAVRYAVRLVTPADPSWPGGLNDLGFHAPIALWVRGLPSTLSTLDRSDWDAAELDLALFA